ncbi:hypothetical protein BGW38_004416 [Lunasporangiospora selenospora]|uniref:Uncharacterized protein n=1 Tax=Lunasporangiospora selenospora TaxID=979761 RepID=A0A9P6FQJ2_9FUNG|nr:hypothetical protein BGW38_004416 [Lunasporangiospora selenospora]
MCPAVASEDGLQQGHDPPSISTPSPTPTATNTTTLTIAPTGTNSTTIKPITPTQTLTQTNTRTLITSTSSTSSRPQNSTTPEPQKDKPKEDDSGSSQGLIIGGAAIGGLVFAIGIAIIAFRCIMNSKDRDRRNKEMAATLAENFDRSDPIGTPRKGYLELGDGPATGHGANLNRQGSQDPYYSNHKEGVDEYYNPHYVQERYGGANNGTHGMYEETEMSVIGGNNGRSSPYMDHSVAYPPASVPSSHYPAYSDYGGQGGQGGGYGNGGFGNGGAPRGPQGYLG